MEEEISCHIDTYKEGQDTILELKEEIEKLRNEVEQRNKEKKDLTTTVIEKEGQFISSQIELEELRNQLKNLQTGNPTASIETGSTTIGQQDSGSNSNRVKEMEEELIDLRNFKIQLIKERTALAEQLKESEEMYDKRMEVYNALKEKYAEL